MLAGWASDRWRGFGLPFVKGPSSSASPTIWEPRQPFWSARCPIEFSLRSGRRISFCFAHCCWRRGHIGGSTSLSPFLPTSWRNPGRNAAAAVGGRIRHELPGCGAQRPPRARVLKKPPWLNDFRKTLLYILITAVGVPAVVALARAYVRILDDQSSEYWLYVAQWYVSRCARRTDLRASAAGLVDRQAKTAAGDFSTSIGSVCGRRPVAGFLRDRLESELFGRRLRTLPAFLYLPLPFILWSAIRFGARGASAAILIITVVAIWHASRGASLFGANDPESSVLSLQLFLIGISIPILLLGSAIEQLRNAERGARELIGVFLHEHDQERREIAYNLHESAAQNLTAAMLTTQTLRSQLPQARQPDVDELQTLIRRTIDDLRRMSYLLYPPMLDEAGLSLALRSYADSYERQNGVKVDLLLPPESEHFTAKIRTRALPVRARGPRFADRFSVLAPPHKHAPKAYGSRRQRRARCGGRQSNSENHQGQSSGNTRTSPQNRGTNGIRCYGWQSRSARDHAGTTQRPAFQARRLVDASTTEIRGHRR